ncbi:hypothetical protein WN55_08162 [Dufourea novaeangliae]|uniref:Uncharacterized protein n=1 Tax=Dufourea novaeangliae TaxID=178035 RepID=A0A154P4W8_DUFNO|nr:hypothetical protein WN55_08162 [Dufourea novaeangliae]
MKLSTLVPLCLALAGSFSLLPRPRKSAGRERCPARMRKLIKVRGAPSPPHDEPRKRGCGAEKEGFEFCPAEKGARRTTLAE